MPSCTGPSRSSRPATPDLHIKINGASFQLASPDPALHISAAAAFQDNAVDAGAMKQEHEK